MAIMSKEYYADIESVYKKPEDYELAGKGNAYIRIDAEAKVTGTAVYTDDVYLPGMLSPLLPRRLSRQRAERQR